MWNIKYCTNSCALWYVEGRYYDVSTFFLSSPTGIFVYADIRGNRRVKAVAVCDSIQTSDAYVLRILTLHEELEIRYLARGTSAVRGTCACEIQCSVC